MNTTTMTDNSGDDLLTLTHRASGIDIDLSHINQSLDTVNNFSKRRQAATLPPVLMYEINSKGEGIYKNMSLRELLQYVNQEANLIDFEYFGEAINTELSNSTVVPILNPAKITTGSKKAAPRASFYVTAPISQNSGKIPHNFPSALTVANDEEASESKTFEAVSTLRLRDLRRLDFQFNPNEEKSMLIRRHAVLFAMDPIRAVVMANKLILIVPDGADTLISILEEYMKEWKNLEALENQEETSTTKEATSIKQLGKRKQSTTRNRYDTIPFEAHAYEALLTTVKALETQEFEKLNNIVQETLSYFKAGGALLPVELQEQMRALKNGLSLMVNRVSSSRKALEELTEDDEEMALMNLSILRNDPSLYRFPLIPEILSTHDEIEELVESYLIDFNSLELKISFVRTQIQSAEELVSLRLDTSRNELLIANTALSVLACSIGFGGYLTGIFGMNLDNVETIQPVKYSFTIVCVVSFSVIVIIFFVTISYLQYSGTLPSRLNIKK